MAKHLEKSTNEQIAAAVLADDRVRDVIIHRLSQTAFKECKQLCRAKISNTLHSCSSHSLRNETNDTGFWFCTVGQFFFPATLIRSRSHSSCFVPKYTCPRLSLDESFTSSVAMRAKLLLNAFTMSFPTPIIFIERNGPL